MDKIFSILLISIISMALPIKAASKCESTSNSTACSKVSAVTIENIQPTTCQTKKGSITVLYKASGVVAGTLIFSATNNLSQKTYSTELPVANSSESIKKIGVITGIPAGTYTVSTKFFPDNGREDLTCIYTCTNIKVKATGCHLLACCLK